MTSARKLYQIGTLCFFSMALAACNNSGGGGGNGGGGGGATPSGTSCSYNLPTVDFAGISSLEREFAIESVGQAVVTSDSRLAVPVYAVGGGYNALIWDGTQWTAKQIAAPGSFSSMSFENNELNLFALGSQLIFQISANTGNGLPLYDWLFTEDSPNFDAPIQGVDVDLYTEVPNAFGGSQALGRITAGASTQSQLYFLENSASGSYQHWNQELVDSTGSSYYQPVQTGFFTDNTAYIIAQEPGSTGAGGSLSVFHRVGAVWSKLFDLTTVANSVTITNPYAVINSASNRSFVFWTEFSSSPQNHVDLKAAVIDLSAQTESNPILILSQNTNDMNGTKVSAGFKSDGTGVFAVHDYAEGLMWTGTISSNSFQWQSYRTDVEWTGAEFFAGVLGCDQGVLLGVDNSNALYVEGL